MRKITKRIKSKKKIEESNDPLTKVTLLQKIFESFMHNKSWKSNLDLFNIMLYFS